MTKLEKTEIKRKAKKAMKENGFKVLQKDIVLLECGYHYETYYGCRILVATYVMFEDNKTNKQYQCYYGNYNLETNSLWKVEEYIA